MAVRISFILEGVSPVRVVPVLTKSVFRLKHLIKLLAAGSRHQCGSAYGPGVDHYAKHSLYEQDPPPLESFAVGVLFTSSSLSSLVSRTRDAATGARGRASDHANAVIYRIQLL